jgi:cytochrome P450
MGIGITVLGISALFMVCYGIYSHFSKPQARPVPDSMKQYKQVPIVEDDYLPFVGQGFAFSKDIIGFIKKCYEKYGPVFRIKIFRTDLIVVCDPSLVKEYFAVRENNMSMYKVLDRLYLGNAFNDDPSMLSVMIEIIKSSIGFRAEEFIPKIHDEAKRMIDRLKLKAGPKGKVLKVSDEMIQFVACTSCRCFMGIELTPEIYDVLMQFTHLLNRIIVLTYFMPKWLIGITINPFLRAYRIKITDYFKEEIRKYRVDLTKEDSALLRHAVDYVMTNDRKLTDQEVGDLVVTLLYVSSENTALGLSAAVVDLAGNPTYWERVKQEARKYINIGDIKGLFSARIIDDCVMESARLNSHVFAINRAPQNALMVLGDYFVGDAQSVALCEPMLMKECQEINGTYCNGLAYNPDRFNKPTSEPKDAHHIMTWGAGVHLCPGKLFAIYEIKMAMALVAMNFKIELPSRLPPLDYFSPSAFAERVMDVRITPLGDEECEAIHVPTDKTYKIYKVGKYEVVYFSSDPLKSGNAGGWLIREFFTKHQQIEFYKYTVNLSKGSDEHKEIMDSSNAPTDRAYPLTYYNLVYTNKSNCIEPVAWFDVSRDIWKILSMTPEVPLTQPMPRFDSVYAHLFGPNGSMAIHRDEYVNWGVSVNLGASSEFIFGPHVIDFHSGDVFVADFSKVDHGVKSILNNSPQWFIPENTQGVDTFGRTRCGIQIRNVSECMPKDSISLSEFKKLVTGA